MTFVLKLNLWHVKFSGDQSYVLLLLRVLIYNQIFELRMTVATGRLLPRTPPAPATIKHKCTILPKAALDPLS